MQEQQGQQAAAGKQSRRLERGAQPVPTPRPAWRICGSGRRLDQDLTGLVYPTVRSICPAMPIAADLIYKSRLAIILVPL
jgi:hypothetical protein